jgi:hypothetical protein
MKSVTGSDTMRARRTLTPRAMVARISSYQSRQDSAASISLPAFHSRYTGSVGVYSSRVSRWTADRWHWPNRSSNATVSVNC